MNESFYLTNTLPDPPGIVKSAPQHPRTFPALKHILHILLDSLNRMILLVRANLFAICDFEADGWYEHPGCARHERSAVTSLCAWCIMPTRRRWHRNVASDVIDIRQPYRRRR